MRSRLSGLMIGLGLSLSTGILPAQAQFSETQVGAFVDALRQAAPQTGKEDDGLYSDWQVQAQNIPRWSKSCIGKELTPAQFQDSPVTARSIITCVVRDVLKEEYQASNKDQALAVRRAASWWMTGDPARYNTGDTATYTQKVLSFYQQKAPTTAIAPKPNQPTPSASQPPSPPAQTDKPATTQAQNQGTLYDRYMRAGYTATRQKDYSTALLYFKRALDERPEDTFATQAIRNVEGYINRPQTTAPKPQTTTATPRTTPPAATADLSQQQAVDLVNRWLQAKAEIFAPPFNQYRLAELTAGELYASLIRPDGVLDWLKSNRAYYRYGVQKVDSVERFVVDRDRATIELKVTEDRTLYLDGTIDPKQTDFSAKQVRFSLELAEGKWKITDYKTVDGSLLERSVVTASQLPISQ